LVLSASDIVQTINEEGIALPRHIAIMLDGNGRWAQRRGLPRTEGHQAGGSRTKSIVQACGEIGIRYLTLFGFSTENWKRPWEEVQALLSLLKEYLLVQIEELRANNVRLIASGRITELPPEIQDALAQTKAYTAGCDKMVLNLAINYGGRAEIIDACNRLLADPHRDEILSLSEAGALDQFLYSAQIPFPDILVRTSGERRISNFLLWEASKTFFWITPTLWPDFSLEDLLQALREFHAYRLSLARQHNPQIEH
jgi:undecaprenyl diphosphate synthase